MRLLLLGICFIPQLVFSQQKKHIVELDYSRRKVDNSQYYLIMDSNRASYEISDSLIVNKQKYNCQTLSYSFKLIDNI
jgi:hypothetical protein